MGLGGIYALQQLFRSSFSSPYPSHFTSKPTEEERRESDEKSKAVVAVSEEGDRERGKASLLAVMRVTNASLLLKKE